MIDAPSDGGDVPADDPRTRDGRALDALTEVARVLAAHAGQRATLREVLKVLDHDLGMARGTVMLVSADGSELVVEAAPAAQPGAEDSRYQRGEGVTGRVLQTGESAIIPDISREPQFRDRIHQRQRRGLGGTGFICVPIVVGTDVIGTLGVDVPNAAEHRLVRDERILRVVASMVAGDANARRMADLERRALEAENLRLQEHLQERFRFERIVGNSGPMRSVYARIKQVADSDTTVLIRGESGTGKELVASAIHYNSPRCRAPFVRVNCAALNENLVESELFGHERGAFTGAASRRIGRIEEADGGTLFLDEMGDFSLTTQVKLLRVIQERQFERVGSNETRKADVRLIAATHRNLEKMVKDGSFRQDLYYRIHVFPIHLPPLRERGDDVLLLANHFVSKYATQMGKRVGRISTPAINMLMSYHWPGNVRELENCIEHAVLLSDDEVIHGHSLPPTLQTPTAEGGPTPATLKSRVQILEREIITDALKRHSGSVAEASKELGITSRMVRYKMKSLGIDHRSSGLRRGK